MKFSPSQDYNKLKSTLYVLDIHMNIPDSKCIVLLNSLKHRVNCTCPSMADFIGKRIPYPLCHSVSNRTSDECMKSNQDHRKFRVQCTSGVFCRVHERSECTLQNTKICTVLWIYGGRDLISSMNYVCNCECVPIRWSTNVLSVRVKHSDIFFFMYGSI